MFDCTALVVAFFNMDLVGLTRVGNLKCIQISCISDVSDFVLVLRLYRLSSALSSALSSVRRVFLDSELRKSCGLWFDCFTK